MKNIAYSSDYKEKVNLENSQDLLKNALDTWSLKAPDPDGFFAKEILKLFRYKPKEVMDTAYGWLFENHNSSYFPNSTKWAEAIKYAEMMTSTSNNSGDWLTVVKVGDRFITKLDKHILDLVKDFENSPMIDKFKAMKCWDKIREDYTYTPNSLTAYVVEIFRKQFVILNKIPVSLPCDMVDKSYYNSNEFREKTLEKGFVSLDLLRKQDIDALVKRAKEK